MNQLNAFMALEIMHDSLERAERQRRARVSREQRSDPHYDAVTIRRTTPDDWTGLERLAQLEGRAVPAGPALVAEVGDRILAAHWTSDDVTLADPFLPTGELVSLLEARARQLGERPRRFTRPLRRALGVLRRAPATLRP
jgi:hypothetical protein